VGSNGGGGIGVPTNGGGSFSRRERATEGPSKKKQMKVGDFAERERRDSPYARKETGRKVFPYGKTSVNRGGIQKLGLIAHGDKEGSMNGRHTTLKRGK